MVGGGADRFGRSQHEDAAGVEGEMEKGQQSFLQFSGEINEQVTAAEQVEFGEGWIHDEILRREDYHLANFLADAIAPVLLRKEPLQPFGRNIRFDAARIQPLPGDFDGLNVDVRREHLDLDVPPGLEFVETLPQD